MSKHRRFRLDLPAGDVDHPERGDVLVGPRATYDVLDAQPVESKQHPNRWRLTVVRLGDATNHRCDSYDHVAHHWSCWHYTPHRR